MKILLPALLGALALAAPAGPATPMRDSAPVFSPDGRTIAFVRWDGATSSLMLMERDGSGLRTLASSVYPQYLTWSPDGRSLAYSGDGIRRVEVATGKVTRLTEDDPGIWQPAWSPDGTSIAYSQFERCFRCTGIWVMAADGTDKREILQDGHRPAWSPDGTKLALSGGPLVIDLEGRTVVPAGGWYATWSPRGTYVATTANGLAITNVATGRTRRITRLMGERPAWSPDGTVIAGSYKKRVALVRVRDGRLLRVLADSVVTGRAPSWSPAGVVTFAHAGSCGIDVAREDGTHRRRLTRTC